MQLINLLQERSIPPPSLGGPVHGTPLLKGCLRKYDAQTY